MYVCMYVCRCMYRGVCVHVYRCMYRITMYTPTKIQVVWPIACVFQCGMTIISPVCPFTVS